MNRRVQVRRRKDVPVTAVYEGVKRGMQLEKYTPDYFCSRIWMGVCPPEEDDPGYAAVVGEVYEPHMQQRERPLILLDEGVALDPRDFTLEEQARIHIAPDNTIRPTKKRLGQAVVALKDIYWPQLVLVPPGVVRSPDAEHRGNPFTEFIRRLDGLLTYDQGLGASQFARWFPFFSSVRRTTDGVIEVEHEDRDYNQALLDSLFEADLLTVNEHCDIFTRENPPQITRRCVGMIVAEMEVQDMTYQMRRWTFGDGYAEPVDDLELEEMVDDQVEANQELWAWWAGEAN